MTGLTLDQTTEGQLAVLFSNCQAGAVPTLCPAYGLETFLDRALSSLSNVYFEAGAHEKPVHTGGEEFLTLPGGARQATTVMTIGP